MNYSLASAFREHARTAPEAPAVRWRGTTVTYAGLAELADEASVRLNGLPPGPIGLVVPKSPTALALILGCLGTGRAVLLPSPTLPSPTLHELFEQAGCVAIIDDTTWFASEPSRTSVEPGFLLTTSGSTGVPKIVPLGDAATVAFARWAHSALDLGPGRVVLNYAPLNFDLCLLDIWATLAAGGCCVLVDAAQATNGRALAGLVADCHVVQGVPLLFELLAAAQPVATAVQHVIVTGDAIRAECLARLPQMFPGAQLYNVYGCTETNDSLMGPLKPGAAATLGEPLPGVRTLLMGSDGPIAGEGVGELWVHTPFQTAGYLHGAQADRFVDRAGLRYFRSGDLVRRHPDGALTIVGRTDFQVKVAGQRVNLQEVEQCLLAHPEVLEAAVVAVDDERYGRRLHAAVHRRPGSALDSLQLRRHCVERLSSGAGVPKTMAIGDQALPRTSTGKVDRNRIKESGWTA